MILTAMRGVILALLLIGVVAQREGHFRTDVTWMVRSESIQGKATYYGTGPGDGYAAAGSEIQRWLGPHWRGQFVTVCGTGCVTVRLIDTCGCQGRRIIDLAPGDFSKVGALWQGVVPVSVSRVSVSLPPTDSAGGWLVARPLRFAV